MGGLSETMLRISPEKTKKSNKLPNIDDQDSEEEDQKNNKPSVKRKEIIPKLKEEEQN